MNGEFIIQTPVTPTGTSCTVKLAGNLAAATVLWSNEPTEAELRNKSASNIDDGTTNVRIGVAEFGGVLTTSDYLLLSDTEIVKVVDLISTEIKSLIVTDGGDPENDSKYRDEVFEVRYPFKQNKVSLLKTINRFYRIDWCNDTLALGYDYWWNTRNTKTYVFSPSNSNKKPKIIIDRNYQDRYNDPGSFVKRRNFYGKSILAVNKNNIFLMGDGFRDDGQFPFIDKVDLNSLKKVRHYESSFKDKKEE